MTLARNMLDSRRNSSGNFGERPTPPYLLKSLPSMLIQRGWPTPGRDGEQARGSRRCRSRVAAMRELVPRWKRPGCRPRAVSHRR